MSMKLQNYTTPDLCVAGLRAANREECLEALCERLAEQGHVQDARALLDDLLSRERIESTGIGRGIALPHARTAQVPGSVVVIARLAEPIPFEALDGEPVDLVFLLVGAKELPGQQLRVLARISKLVRIDSFLAQLRGAATPAEILAALRDAEARHF